jgi:Sulfotransferase family
MMTSPEWTRAIFVRDPKQRFLSAFLDKAVADDGWHILKTCCKSALDCEAASLGGGGTADTTSRTSVRNLLESCHHDQWDSRSNVLTPHWNVDVPCCDILRKCREGAETFEGFLHTIQTCHDPHWSECRSSPVGLVGREGSHRGYFGSRELLSSLFLFCCCCSSRDHRRLSTLTAPQYGRMESKYWKYVNFVGHMETMNEDTKRLLQRIGAWEKWGATGWGPHGNASILSLSQNNQSHTTGATFKTNQWYTPERERMVEKFYAVDYGHPAFQFTIQNLTKPFVPPSDGKFVKRGDSIYSRNDWDGAPVVVEKYKLIFFTIPKVGATVWKQAFRRMEGYDDWLDIGGTNGLPHDPSRNGLKYLYDYDMETAEGMMTSSEWTRAIFVRSPKDRFLSVFYQMSRNRAQIDRRCCPHQPGCSSTLRSMARFVDLMATCYSSHWAPFSERMEDKYWPYINFVGTIENVQDDSKKLLIRLGAWEAIGKKGWGGNQKGRIFAKDDHVFDDVRDSLAMYTSQVDRMLDKFYKDDYESKYFTVPTKGIWIMQA